MSIANKFYIIEDNRLSSFTEEEKEIAEVVYMTKHWNEDHIYRDAVKHMIDMFDPNEDYTEMNERLEKTGINYKVVKEDCNKLTMAVIHVWGRFEFVTQAYEEFLPIPIET